MTLEACTSTGFCLRGRGGCPCILDGTHAIHACTHAYLWSTAADHAPPTTARMESR